jgi:uncharacterized metal-binding protein
MLKEKNRINILFSVYTILNFQYCQVIFLVVQAILLDEEKTDFNILVGLCVGHDSLFFKYSKAFTTVPMVKDRVLAHNPAGALYTTGSYYARLMKPRIDLVEHNE